MCGITGIFNRDSADVDLNVLISMTDTLHHRGPDEEGYFINSSNSKKPSITSKRQVQCLIGSNSKKNTDLPECHVGLGHRRLSIIDLATGQQPLCNETSDVWIAFNGEIYNFLEIIPELEAHGHKFRTKSDTEVIIHAYEQWGHHCLERLRGMFAFAIWDQRQQKLFAARDRVGKKPFYYHVDDTRFVFASEIKAILKHGNMNKDIDLTALSDYLSLLYIPSPKTIFKSIRKLPAGHFLEISKDRFDVKPYWNLSFQPVHALSEGNMMEDLLCILDEATQIRRISEVPLGAFLSGGVDSSAVVALMANASEEPVITNSISFGVERYNEVHYARRVAKLFNTAHHEFHVTPEALNIVEKLAWHYDEPFADSSAVPTYYVSKIARENVTVSLSGDGGDENFAGYRRYYFDLRENMVRNTIPHKLRDPIFGTLGRLYPKADYLPQIFRGKAFISNVARDPVEAYFFSVSAINETDKKRLLNNEVLHEIDGYRSSDLFHEIYNAADGPDHLSKIQYLDIKTYLCEDILTKVDRASMAVSLEVRCPVLDHRFMEYVARIPSKYKLSGRVGKKIFKTAMSKFLPDDILYRKKMGFGVPINEWFRNELKQYSKKVILEGQASKTLLNPISLNRIWREHQSGMKNRSTELWTIMMLNLWFKNYM